MRKRAMTPMTTIQRRTLSRTLIHSNSYSYLYHSFLNVKSLNRIDCEIWIANGVFYGW